MDIFGRPLIREERKEGWEEEVVVLFQSIATPPPSLAFWNFLHAV